MKKTVMLEGGIVCEMKKHRRARCLRIIVHRDGSVSLTLPFFVSYREGAAFLKGRTDWIREKCRVFSGQPEDFLMRGSDGEYRKHADEARELILRRLEHFQKEYAVQWGRVSIRNQKTRWGSCSKSGNLSFNYRLLSLPERLRDYVIVHELCHLIAFDHSARFWKLVGRTFPDYRELRGSLRLMQMFLMMTSVVSFGHLTGENIPAIIITLL